DSHRQQGNELHHPFEAEFCSLAGHVRNLDRTSELAFVLTPDSEALQEFTCSHDDMAGFVHRLHQSASRTVADLTRLPELLVVDHPDHAEFDGVSERILLLDDFRRGVKRDLSAI